MKHAVTSVLLALAMRGNADAPPCGVTIIAYNFRNSHGTAAIAIYADAEGFPDAPEKAVGKALAPIEHGSATVTVSDRSCSARRKPERENGQDFAGPSKEGHGVSNNAKQKTFGPPSFHEAAFALNTEGRMLTIDIHY
jgi:uncharacterized protein (DUF2141 family)